MGSAVDATEDEEASRDRFFVCTFGLAEEDDVAVPPPPPMLPVNSKLIAVGPRTSAALDEGWFAELSSLGAPLPPPPP